MELLGRCSKLPPLPQFTLEPRTGHRTDRSPRASTKVTPRRHKLTNRLSDADRAQMVEAYAAGTSTRQLMEHYGIGKGTILRLLNEAGVTRKLRSPTEEQLAEAARLHIKEQWPLEKIGQHFGFRAGTIHLHLKRRGVPMRRSWDHLLPPEPPQPR